MWGWIAPLIEGLARFLKTIFGTDQPVQNIVKEARPHENVIPSDDSLLRDLGVFDRRAGVRRADDRPDDEA